MATAAIPDDVTNAASVTSSDAIFASRAALVGLAVREKKTVQRIHHGFGHVLRLVEGKRRRYISVLCAPVALSGRSPS